LTGGADYAIFFTMMVEREYYKPKPPPPVVIEEKPDNYKYIRENGIISHILSRSK